jgi:hypothetical protein
MANELIKGIVDICRHPSSARRSHAPTLDHTQAGH